jgi:hypothetical protein
LKVFWEILEKRLFSGPGVPENGRQPKLTQEVVRSLPNGHLSFALPISSRLQDFCLTVIAHIQISFCVPLFGVGSSLSASNHERILARSGEPAKVSNG